MTKRTLALLLALSLAAGCEHAGEVLSYGADGMPKPAPSPMDLVPPNTQPAPELAPDRRVNEQDCSKPVDVTSGNLRCK